MSDEFDSLLNDESHPNDDSHLDFNEEATPDGTLILPPATPRILGESPVGGKPPILPRIPVEPEQSGKETTPPPSADLTAADAPAEGETPWHSSDSSTLQALSAPTEEEPPVSQIEAPELKDFAPEPEKKLDLDAQIAALQETPEPKLTDLRVPDLDAQIAALQEAPEPKLSDLRMPDLDAQIEALRQESEAGPGSSPFAGADMSWLNVDAPIEPPTIVHPPESKAERLIEPTSVEKPIIEEKPGPASKVTVREVPPSPDSVARKEEWEDDISPELAAVLFGGQQKAAPPAEAAPAVPAPVSTPVEIPATGPQVISAPSEPVHLTERAHARVKPLTAKELYSPAPDAALSGKVRSVRIEEPLPDDDGDRFEETRDYLRPNLPGLDGRLVKRVKIEETRFADGSWHWTFEREYSDGGSDKREVRANRDDTFIIRKDTIDKPDIATNKRVKRRDEEAMIFAPPPPEEKRGFLSNLLGKKEEAPAGPASWRTATADEIKAARKTSGRAF